MGNYRVTFLKTLRNAYGTPFLACHRAVDVAAATSANDASEAAKRYLERIERVTDWTQHADTFQVSVAAPPAARQAGARTG